MRTVELSDTDNMILWMACRYACRRQSIACTTLPMTIVKRYVQEMSYEQRKSLSEDILREVKEASTWGHPADLNWSKLAKAMDEKHWIRVEAVDGTMHTCFEVADVLYPLTAYLDNPHRETFIPKENIKATTKYVAD